MQYQRQTSPARPHTYLHICILCPYIQVGGCQEILQQMGCYLLYACGAISQVTILTYLIFTMFLIFCRLKKCYAVGMRADCVVPEDQCIKKRMAKSKNNETNSTSPLSNGHAHERHLSGGSDNGIVMTGVLTHTANGSLKRQVVPFVSRPLKPEEEELINRLVYFQIEYEFPKEEDLKKIYHVPLHCQGTESESDSLFRHITEMTILTVNLIVEFCKHLPGFTSLDKEDQVVILKGCSSEVMMLRAARRYVISFG